MLNNTALRSHRDWFIDIFCLAIILLAFYSFWLGGYPLFTPDEGRYSEVAREMIVTGDYITPRVNGVVFLDKPVLYYWLQTIAIHLFGLNEWALRLFPMLLGICGCLMTYICGRCLFGRRTGLLSAIILATTPLYFGNAHYANLDLEVTVFISNALLCFITGLTYADRENHPRHLQHYFIFAGYIFSALAVLTKGLIGIAFPVMILLTWMVLLRRWDILKKIHLCSGTLLFLLIALPWYVLVQQINPEFLHYFFVTQQVTRFLSEAEFNNASPVWFYVPIVIFGFFPWTIFMVQALSTTIRNVWQHRSAHAAELFLLLWLIIIFIFFSIPHSKTVGYILPITPALALLIGHYLSGIWKQPKNNSVYYAITNFVILGTIFAGISYTMPQHKLMDISAKFIPYMNISALIFIASAFSSVLFIRSKKLLPLFVICTACSVAFLLTLILGAAHFNQNSAKALVLDLKTVLKPDDEVITYFKYYQDVPLYLEQRVMIATNWNAPGIADRDNWTRELRYGMAYEKTDDWLIDENAFWQHWYSEKRVFVFINENYMDQFKLRAKSYFILGRDEDIMLLSNKPTYLSKYRDNVHLFL